MFFVKLNHTFIVKSDLTENLVRILVFPQAPSPTITNLYLGRAFGITYLWPFSSDIFPNKIFFSFKYVLDNLTSFLYFVSSAIISLMSLSNICSLLVKRL